ncbi:hypothetical protein PBY51_017490 [Eleginops maclovinus]|uniref:Uncharacterized protein n=1 Tax=Eleginops maclovinus TaxID=56733 RepID=A0AAN8AP58_ELEMC|nr:hypothetical protein PBY51_017490 [Eleginops maclovinus]
MALKHLLLLLLWIFNLFPHVVTSLCNVSCTTDFVVSLNCSCLGSLPPSAVLLSVNCSYYQNLFHGSCEVKPPQSWCVVHSEQFEEITYLETYCTTTVSQQGVDRVLVNASEPWGLGYVVKPQRPIDVQVRNTDGFYNITWDHINTVDCLIYRVCVRESKNLSKDPVYSISGVQNRLILLDSEKLQAHVNYTVDVQAKMCPDYIYMGPWSEWSSSAEWTTTGTSEIKGINGHWWYISLPVILVLLVLLGYSKKLWWKKKLQRILYIPKADEFFKPLDFSHGGNFKEWVKPIFRECDYVMINSNAQMIGETQHKVLQWNNEKQSNSEGNGMDGGVDLFHALQPRSGSMLFFQDGGSSQGAGHSTGHVSIHTVTLSGGEEFEEEVVSQSSVNTYRSFQDRENVGSFEGDNRDHSRYALEEPHRRSGISNDLLAENRNFQPPAQIIEQERVSLDSFASNEHSEDGYPHMDLDTIDSGFGECSSPGASDSKMLEQINSELCHDHKSSNSNYVKQWMICGPIQEGSSNSENELFETP